MKKILILTCSTGEGHNSAARAMAANFTHQNIQWEIRDPVSFQSERMTHLVADLYNDTIRKTPNLFGVLYKAGDLYSASRLPSPIYWANSRYAENLKSYILQNGFDGIFCTHLYGMEAMTAIRRDPDFHVPCYGILTDYVTIPFLDDINVTGLFVPTEAIRRTLISRGKSPENIIVSGIPVDPGFTDHPDGLSSRKALGLPLDKKLYLVMTGGVGCENMEKLCGKLVNALEETEKAIVFAGKNGELQNRLTQRFGSTGKLTAIGFTNQVSLYMAAGDVLLSKPGGLSSTEAAVANIPLVHLHAIPGCETHNARFFAEHGMSCNASDDEEAVSYAKFLARNESAAEKMRTMQRAYVNPHAAQKILKEVNRPWLARM